MTIEEFAAILQAQQKAKAVAGNHFYEQNYTVKIRPGKKYTKVDVGDSGKYMITETGEIFGIKAYGVIHRGHQYGTLDTVNDWEWSGYAAVRIEGGEK